jgi:RHS repeat-associated protein/uncharacterized repeat protein (TIGR01451 family)
VTLVSEKSIKIAGSRPTFEPYHDGLLLLAGANTTNAIDVATSSSKFLGVIFAGAGQISVSGSSNRFYCGVLGDRVDITGADTDIRGAACGRPDATVADPVLVPDLRATLAVDREEALPREDLGYDLTITNAGATLVVPALVGLENVDEVTETVTGYDFGLERLDTATNTWVPLASKGDEELRIDLRPNPYPDVVYPTGNGVADTVVPAGGWATWGLQAALAMTPEQTKALLDPEVTAGIRTRVDFQLTPSGAQARRLFTHGDDFIAALRDQGADVTAAEATLVLPSGATEAISGATAGLTTITPGASIDIDRSWAVPAPAERADAESDQGYLSRLRALDGTPLTAASFVLATGGVGRLVAPLSTATTTRELPVVKVATEGPSAVTAGTEADYTLRLANIGSRTADGLDVKATAAGAPLTVADPPTTLDAGELATATTSYRANATPAGGTVPLRGSATWSDAVGNTYGETGSTLPVTEQAPAKIRATLAEVLVGDPGGDGAASPGDRLRYTLVVRNIGDVLLAGVTATIPLDQNTHFVADSAVVPAGGTSSHADGVMTITLPDIPGNSARTATYDVTIRDPFPNGVTNVTTQGTITATGLDPALTDDVTEPGAADPTVTPVIRSFADLAALLTGRLAIDADGSGTVTPGDTLAYRLELTSLGTQLITSLRASVPTPAGTSLVPGSVTTSQGTVTPDAVSADLGDLGPFQAADVRWRVAVDEPLATDVTAISAQAEVTSDQLAAVLSDDPATAEVGDPTVLPVGQAPGEPDRNGPVIGDVTPADGTVVTEPVHIQATLTPPDGLTLNSWVVDYRRADDTNVTVLATGSGGTVDAVLDPTVLPNGTYVVTVRGTTDVGGLTTREITLVVDGDMKLGRYTTTLTDMTVGVAGLPIQVQRSYDSFDKSTGDFGVGWSLDLADFQIASNGPLGDGGWTMQGCGGGLIFSTLCFTSDRPHFVTVTWPDGRNEMFDLTPAEGSTFFTGLTSAKFTGRPGTTSTLEAVDSDLFWVNGNLNGGAFGGEGIYNPQEFVLTDRFGTEYTLQVDAGLKQIEEISGNVTTFTKKGITSSRGPSVTLTRDDLDRITQVTGPDGKTVTYGYDAEGDLDAVTNQLGKTTTYDYLPGHYLDKVTGPDSGVMARFEYTDGRITAVIDGEGNRTEIGSVVGARQETVTDPGGMRVTVKSYDADGLLVRINEIYSETEHATEFAYDDNHNVVSRTDPSGRTWTARYNGRDLVSFADPGGATIDITYNDYSLPVTWTDQEGEVTTYDWNPNGTLAGITDALGRTESYTYDAAGNRLTRTDRVGNTWRSTSTPRGLVATETDPRGNTTTYAYDENGRITSVTDALDGVTTWEYDAVGNPVTETDPNGEQTTWKYDGYNRLTSRTDAEGFTTSWTYTSTGLVETVTNGEGETTTYAYGPNRRPTAVTVGTLAPSTYEYDGAGRLLVEHDPVGRVTRYGYDPAGRLASVKNPAGGTTNYTYTADGKLATTTDPMGGTTTTTYTPRGLVETVTDALGAETAYEYDEIGRLTATVRPDGTRVRNGYDDASHLVSVTDPAGTTTYGYDAAGNRTSVTDAEGVKTSSVFDELNRLASSEDGLGNATTYTYDPAGWLRKTLTAEGVVTTFGYDGRGLLTSRRDGLGHTWTTSYDAAGRRVSTTNPRGATTSYAFDDVGRPASVTDNAGHTVTFGHDDAGQMTSLKDARGKTWTTTYAPTGGVASKTDPLGNTATWEHDLAGRLVAQTDARGVRQEHTLDALGRTLETAYPGGTVSHGYDPLGHRTTMVDGTGTTTFDYDDAGRLTSVAAPGGTVGYGYDRAGRRTSMTTADGTVAYKYDGAGRLESLTDWAERTVTLGYDQDGRRTSLHHPSGVRSSWSYDDAGRLVDVEHTGPTGQIEKFNYGLDAAGNRTSVTSSAGTETYTLNLLDQLTQVAYADGRVADYGYDAAGNRTSETVDGATRNYNYDDASRLKSAAGTTIEHDAAGNVIRAGSDTFEWDWDGRLAETTADGVTHHYGYDADGLRTEVDGAARIYDRAGSGAAPTLLSDGSTTWLHDGDTPLSAVDDAGAGYLAVDALGSVRAATASSGAVVGRASYDVFGVAQSGSGDVGPFGFTGGQQDPTGDVYLTARHYRPGMGRFLSVDPMTPGAPGVVGYNPYTYVGNNPTTWTDPTGRAVGIEYGILTEDDLAVIAAAEAIVAAEFRRIMLQRLLWALAGVGAAAGGGCAVLCSAPGTGTSTGTGTQPSTPPTPNPDPEPERPPLPLPPQTDDEVGCQPQQVAAWWAALPPGGGLPSGEAGAYQAQVAGVTPKAASGDGAVVRADGVRVESCSLIEAKHVGSESSPYLPGHDLDFVTEDVVDEFRRYGIVARASTTPVTNTVVITNDARAVPVFNAWMTTANGLPWSTEVQGCSVCGP